MVRLTVAKARTDEAMIAFETARELTVVGGVQTLVVAAATLRPFVFWYRFSVSSREDDPFSTSRLCPSPV